MSVVADVLTASRMAAALGVVLLGVTGGVSESIARVVALTIFAWITDVLDGQLARHSRGPTHLGNWDLLADLGLCLAITVALVWWHAIPLLIAAGEILVAAAGVKFLASTAPLRFVMGLVYAELILTAWELAPAWGHTLAGSILLVIALNPGRAWRQVTDFWKDAEALVSRCLVASNDH